MSAAFVRSVVGLADCYVVTCRWVAGSSLNDQCAAEFLVVVVLLIATLFTLRAAACDLHPPALHVSRVPTELTGAGWMKYWETDSDSSSLDPREPDVYGGALARSSDRRRGRKPTGLLRYLHRRLQYSDVTWLSGRQQGAYQTEKWSINHVLYFMFLLNVLVV